MSGGGGSSSTTTVRELAPEQQRLLELTIPTFERFMNPRTQEGLIFPGTVTPGFTPLQLEGQQAVADAARGSAADIAGSATGAFNFLTTDALDPSSNPVIQDIIAQSTQNITDTFQRDIMPGISRSAVGAGQVGGSRQGIAEGLAAEGVTRAVGESTSNILNDAYRAGLNAAGFALTQTPTVQGAAFAPGTALSGVGGQQQAQEALELSEEEQRFLQEAYLPFILAQQVSGAAFGIPAGRATTTGEIGQGGNVFTNTLGGALSGAGLGMAIPGIGPLFGAGGGALLGLLGGMI